MEDFTYRTVAKHIVSAAIGMKVTELTRDAISDHTRFDNDTIVAKITSGVVGWGVQAKLRPYTDKAVDKTADFVNAKREARKARQNAAETEK